MSIQDDLISAGAIRFGRFTLTSGKESPYYVDVKMASTQPRTLRRIVEALMPRVQEAEILAGVELGAVPIMVGVALATGKPFVIIRKPGRTHGTTTQIEGGDVKGRRVVLLEDVTTTGGSVVNAVNRLRTAGATIVGVETVVDRQEGAAEALQALNVNLRALVTATDLLSHAEAAAS